MIIVFSVIAIIASIVFIHIFLDEDAITYLLGIVGVATLLISGVSFVIMITTILVLVRDIL